MGPTGKLISVSVRVVRAGEEKLCGRESSFPVVARGVGVGQNVLGRVRPMPGQCWAGGRRCWAGVGAVLGRCWPVLSDVGRCWKVLAGAGRC